MKTVLEKIIGDSKKERVLDCGAGIGRVVELLLQFFNNIDILEPAKNMLDEAVELIKKLPTGDKVGHFHTQVKDFEFKEKYDCIYLGYVVAFLSTDELKQFFAKAIAAKVDMIIVRENVFKPEKGIEEIKGFIARTKEEYQTIFTDSGLEINF